LQVNFRALVGFFERHPRLRKRGLFLSGEASAAPAAPADLDAHPAPESEQSYHLYQSINLSIYQSINPSIHPQRVDSLGAPAAPRGGAVSAAL